MGEYSEFKYVEDAGSEDFDTLIENYTPSRAVFSPSENNLLIDHNGDGVNDYSGSPNFNFGQFRHNLVLRWEYIPGSTFFLVWAINADGGADVNFDRRNFGANITDLQQTNTFLMKYTYRFRL